MHFDVDVEIAEAIDSDLAINRIKILILWNDDHNTFEHVIECLIKYAGKMEAEANKIAFIVHSKGKCSILEGEKSELIECYNILKLKNLSVSIE